MKLTNRQAAVLRAIEDYQQQHGWSPTIRELMPLIGVSSLRGCTVHLDALCRKGVLVRGSGPRQIRVVKR